MREVSYEGTVQSVYSNENNFLVRIGVTNLPTQLLPGMTADVAISIGEHKGVFVVPTNAIESGKTIHIKRKDSGKLELISIKTGIVDGASAEVQSSELVEGDLLVVKRKPGA
jgi:multidrug efflux pump subunit AcrA (membrane-fusion protein)